MNALKFGLVLVLAWGSSAWACKTTSLAAVVYDYEAMFAYLRRRPELAPYTISKIERDERMYTVSLETLNDVKCQLTLKVSNAPDCERTVTTFGASTCR